VTAPFTVSLAIATTEFSKVTVTDNLCSHAKHSHHVKLDSTTLKAANYGNWQDASWQPNEYHVPPV
jgi:hypothetical protein